MQRRSPRQPPPSSSPYFFYLALEEEREKKRKPGGTDRLRLEVGRHDSASIKGEVEKVKEDISIDGATEECVQERWRGRHGGIS